MILLYAVIVSIVVSLLRGGRFGSLTKLSFRAGWLAPLAFALQAIIIYFPLPETQGMWAPRTLLLLGTYGLLILVVILNRGLPGFWVLGVGLALNLLVMLANGGFMPVTPEALEGAGLSHLALGQQPGARVLNAKDILLPRESTRLWALSDIFVIPPPLGTAFSPGDLFLALGGFWFFQRGMRPAPSKDSSERTAL